MRTDELIADLAGRAAPVRPLPPPAARTLVWFTLALASAGLGFAVFGIRPGIDVLFGTPDFVFSGLLAILTALFGIFGALVLAIPGAERTAAPRVTTVTALVLWIGLLVWTVALAGTGLSGVSHWYVCFVRVAAIALIPGIGILVMLNRAMPVRHRWAGGLALTGATAIGALAIQFICPIPDAAHALVGHLAPVLCAGLAGTVIGRRRDR